MKRIETRLAALERIEGRVWFAVRQFLDVDHPEQFEGPSDAAVEAKERAGHAVTLLNVTLVGAKCEDVTGPEFRVTEVTT